MPPVDVFVAYWCFALYDRNANAVVSPAVHQMTKMDWTGVFFGINDTKATTSVLLKIKKKVLNKKNRKEMKLWPHRRHCVFNSSKTLTLLLHKLMKCLNASS